MRLDVDIRIMSFARRGSELMRLRNLIRTHKSKKNNARCWLNDIRLYDKALPEGSDHSGKMALAEEVLLRQCKTYIRGQHRGLKKKGDAR